MEHRIYAVNAAGPVFLSDTMVPQRQPNVLGKHTGILTEKKFHFRPTVVTPMRAPCSDAMLRAMDSPSP